MLKNVTLAACLALGMSAVSGIAGQPAEARDLRPVYGASDHGMAAKGLIRAIDWRARHDHRRGFRWRFLRRVRDGRIVCFKKRSHRWGHRFDDRRGYRYGDRRGRRFARAYGRPLGYRQVRRLVRQGRRDAMRCFPTV
ncbi:MAG: hypothetical protein R3229_09975 [Alphaproteobacteria bacterium]|nr:hypothetical protein [Alphaproteobacteria bacterium]